MFGCVCHFCFYQVSVNHFKPGIYYRIIFMFSIYLPFYLIAFVQFLCILKEIKVGENNWMRLLRKEAIRKQLQLQCLLSARNLGVLCEARHSSHSRR